MTHTHYVKQNDTRDPVQATLQDADSNPVDLSEADEVRFQMGRKGKTVVDGEAEIVDAENGEVQYRWNDGDTSEKNIYRAEFRVIFADGTRLTFPNNDWIKIAVTEEVGDL